MPTTVDADLTPLQQDTLAQLRRADDPVVFDPDVIAELRHHADDALGELGARLTADDPLTTLAVSKFPLGEVLECEARWAAPEPEFTWSPPLARGAVCHRAVQLALSWRGDPIPGELVDSALERLVDDDGSLGRWLRALGPADLADVHSICVERVARFLECFPPLRHGWWPVAETTSSYPSTGPIVLRAKPDLTIAVARGAESRKVIVELKSGRLRPRHRDDLRFYALVETLTRRTPPRLLVGFSLEACAPDTEVVTEALLRSALRRTLDAIERMVELKVEGRVPHGCSRRYCRTCAPDGTSPDDER